MKLTISHAVVISSVCTTSVFPANAGEAGSLEIAEIRRIVEGELARGGHSSLSSSALSAQEDPLLKISGQIQFRYILDVRSDEASDDFDTGFQTRRTKIALAGDVGDFSYKIAGAFGRGDGDFELEDAYVGYGFGNGWKVQFGQKKLAFMREENVSSTRQLAVERSIVNEVFNQDRSQMIELINTSERARYTFAFSDGFDSDNSDFSSSSEADYALTARAEYIVAGDPDFKRFKDFTSGRGADIGVLLGAAVHFQDGTDGKGSQTNDPADVDARLLTYIADASAQGDGWNAYAAFVGASHFDRSAGDTSEFNDFGVTVQGGYRVTEKTEPFVRWDAVFLDSDRPGDGDSFNFITVGVNHYVAGHALKFTGDAVVSLNDTSDLTPLSGFPNSGGGILSDADEGEVTVRLQMQLLF